MSDVYSSIYSSSKWQWKSFSTCVSDHSQVNQYSSWRYEQDPMIGKSYLPKWAFQQTLSGLMLKLLWRKVLPRIAWEVLIELGVTTMGHALAILKLAKQQPLISNSYTKAPAVKLPKLHSGMTSQQFRKFRINWEVFVRMTNMPTAQTHIQLYNCADEAVQIINTYPKFFSEEPNRLMGMLEALVTSKSNPMVHRLSFASISQGPGESV